MIQKNDTLIFIDSDVIVHGYMKKLGGPFTSAWQTRYGKLYPSRLELYPESLSGKPEVIILFLCGNISFSVYFSAIIYGPDR